MFALLGLIPIKDWIYCGLIAAILSVGTVAWIRHDAHEQALGKQKIEAADARAVAVQQKHDRDVEAAATAAVQKATETFHAQVAAPTLPAPRLVCRAAAPHPGAVRGAPAASPGGDAATAIPDESTVPFDPAPPILELTKQADAQVALLQAYVAVCQKAKVCRTK